MINADKKKKGKKLEGLDSLTSHTNYQLFILRSQDCSQGRGGGVSLVFKVFEGRLVGRGGQESLWAVWTMSNCDSNPVTLGPYLILISIRPPSEQKSAIARIWKDCRKVKIIKKTCYSITFWRSLQSKLFAERLSEPGHLIQTSLHKTITMS